jgi:hypothetical protein
MLCYVTLRWFALDRKPLGLIRWYAIKCLLCCDYVIFFDVWNLCRSFLFFILDLYEKTRKNKEDQTTAKWRLEICSEGKKTKPGLTHDRTFCSTKIGFYILPSYSEWFLLFQRVNSYLSFIDDQLFFEKIYFYSWLLNDY